MKITMNKTTFVGKTLSTRHFFAVKLNSFALCAVFFLLQACIQVFLLSHQTNALPMMMMMANNNNNNNNQWRESAAVSLLGPQDTSQQQVSRNLQHSYKRLGGPRVMNLVSLHSSSGEFDSLSLLRGSKNEPPSRPPVDRSKRKPYFGTEISQEVNVELGATAHLTCQVFELGDKTVSWLRPRENEILTAGKYTYINDPRFVSINEADSAYWILEIKNTNLNDSTTYECQVSTDPKMSMIINLKVRAARAKIRQGKQLNYPVGSQLELSCEIANLQTNNTTTTTTTTTTNNGMNIESDDQTTDSTGNEQTTYWYFNGNLLNFIQPTESKNFSIVSTPNQKVSRFKLFNIQATDSGNYTCKPSGAEPATVRLNVKKLKNDQRSHSNNNNYQQLNKNHRLEYLAAQNSSSSSTTTITSVHFISLLVLSILLNLFINPTIQ